MDETSAPVSDRAYRALRRKLILCEIEPGSWISESELQEASSLPRTPTREATMRLVHENMLEVFPRRGYRVADISEQSAKQLFDVFLPLMSMAGEFARGHLEEGVLDGIDRALSGDGSVAERMLDATDILVPAILRSSGNPWLVDTTMRLFSHVERLWAFSYTDASMQELMANGFGPILSSLRAGPTDQVSSDRLAEAIDWVREHTLRALGRHLVQMRSTGVASA